MFSDEINVSADRLTHLSAEQRSDLLSVLDEFAICFSYRPGLYTVAVHRIETTAEFKLKRMRAYRMPEVFKPDVEKQIGELLDMGLIRPSVSLKCHEKIGFKSLTVAEISGSNSSGTYVMITLLLYHLAGLLYSYYVYV